MGVAARADGAWAMGHALELWVCSEGRGERAAFVSQPSGGQSQPWCRFHEVVVVFRAIYTPGYLRTGLRRSEVTLDVARVDLDGALAIS
eukprot:scaffold83209_cov67-Phaeocystis_antarctica.AAC.2